MERPDYQADRIDPTRFLKGIKQQGCCLIRGALDTAALGTYYDQAAAAYAFREEQRARGELPESFMRNFYEVGHTLPQDLDPVGGVDGFIDLFVQSPLRRLMKAAMGPKVAFILNNTLPRRCDPAGIVPKTPFHQDATFLGDKVFIINFWTPLQDCGITAPGLEVVTRPIQETEPPPNYDKEELFYYDRMGLEEDKVIEKYGADMLWHPEMKRGDVLAFTDMTIHRTYVTEQMADDRISMEVRFASATAPGLAERGFNVKVVDV